MGWGSGTDIFDCVVEDLLHLEVSDEVFDYVVFNLHRQLCNQDWYNLCESKYYMDERVMEALVMMDDYYEWLGEQENAN